jgi:hypothetical protein
MATLSKSTFNSVTTGNAFSDSATIIATGVGDPIVYENLVFVDYEVNLPISGVTVEVTKVGNNLEVDISGTHGIDPFDNVIKHFTRGKSTRWETPVTSVSFASIDPEVRQVYNWTPDFEPKTIVFTINYTADGVPESKEISQVVTPNYTPFLPDFLASI